MNELNKAQLTELQLWVQSQIDDLANFTGFPHAKAAHGALQKVLDKATSIRQNEEHIND